MSTTENNAPVMHDLRDLASLAQLADELGIRRGTLRMDASRGIPGFPKPLVRFPNFVLYSRSEMVRWREAYTNGESK